MSFAISFTASDSSADEIHQRVRERARDSWMQIAILQFVLSLISERTPMLSVKHTDKIVTGERSRRWIKNCNLENYISKERSSRLNAKSNNERKPFKLFFVFVKFKKFPLSILFSANKEKRWWVHWNDGNGNKDWMRLRQKDRHIVASTNSKTVEFTSAESMFAMLVLVLVLCRWKMRDNFNF